jgi:hypothetical protein
MASDEELGLEWLTKRFEDGGRKYGPIPEGYGSCHPEFGSHWVMVRSEGDVAALGKLVRNLGEAEALVGEHAQRIAKCAAENNELERERDEAKEQLRLAKMGEDLACVQAAGFEEEWKAILDTVKRGAGVEGIPNTRQAIEGIIEERDEYKATANMNFQLWKKFEAAYWKAEQEKDIKQNTIEHMTDLLENMKRDRDEARDCGTDGDPCDRCVKCLRELWMLELELRKRNQTERDEARERLTAARRTWQQNQNEIGKLKALCREAGDVLDNSASRRSAMLNTAIEAQEEVMIQRLREKGGSK